nr:MAG TPA: hypothetical protein [Caudoviricetes sp.]
MSELSELQFNYTESRTKSICHRFASIFPWHEKGEDRR